MAKEQKEQREIKVEKEVKDVWPPEWAKHTNVDPITGIHIKHLKQARLKSGKSI